ncbi:hypothetical protein BDU57DRAFT_534989 [Ampelomyces quisqualis]|uniref:Fe2OG dioxygenase domain-containing protein n=1 Tax=Ampelomyces quisqualis TaxID=50730 RepID=A0A6A5R0U4_AMPQU|nr:hypothetical protein BDU57DRAFT_534989 [Ampelomyces quisqualis]
MADSTIPIISLSSPTASTATQILSAASTHGFLFIANDSTTISPSDIESMFDLSKTFFASPSSEKEKFAIHTPAAGGVNRGWVRMSGESLDPTQSDGDPKEAFNIAPPYPSLQPLPSPLSASADLILRFQTTCHQLCVTILKLLGEALACPDEAYVSARHDLSRGASGSIFRMLYYPPSSTPPCDHRVRAGAHSDYGSLTLLFRLPGQSGLELLGPDGAWTSVPVSPAGVSLPPPILVNIGDLLCYWTNGLLKSTVHRVAFSGGGERYSMAYFCHPLDDARLESVESRVIREFGDKGKEELTSQRKRLGLSGEEGEVITAKEHLERRLRLTYGL